MQGVESVNGPLYVSLTVEGAGKLTKDSVSKPQFPKGAPKRTRTEFVRPHVTSSRTSYHQTEPVHRGDKDHSSDTRASCPVPCLVVMAEAWPSAENQHTARS